MPRTRTIRRILKWFALLLLLAAAAGGAFAWWMWSQADAKLRQVIIEKQQELAPGWDVDLPRAHFDWGRRVHLYDVTVRVPGQPAPVFRLPEVVITIDQERFRETQEVVVQKIRLVRPEAHLTRDAHGAWNWQALLKLPRANRTCPEWEIEQGRVIVRLEHPGARPASVMHIEDCNVRLVPAARRQYVVSAGAQVNEAGDLTAKGRWNLGTRQWNIDGAIHDVRTSGELLRLAAGASPELRSKLHRMDAALRHYQLLTQEDAEMLVSTEAVSPPGEEALHELEVIPDFGIRCTLDVDFRISQARQGAEPDFQMLLRLRQGQMDNEALPFPLRALEGEVYWDNRQIVLRRVTAKNGITQVSLSGRFERQPGSVTPGSVDLRLTKLLLDERLRRRLPPLLGKQFDFLHPTGVVDLDATCHYDGAGRWTYHDLDLRALGCTVTNQRFPYTVTGVTGTVLQQPDGRLEVSLEGRAGREPVKVVGEIQHPGPEAEARFDVRVWNLPLDDTFREACPPAVRKALVAMRAEGSINAQVQLVRPPGPAQRFQTGIRAWLHDCSIEVEAFPYRVSNLSGSIEYDSTKRIWDFRYLDGAHGPTHLTGEGVFRQDRDPQMIDLRITGKGVHLDGEFERALPDSLRRLWADLNLAGQADLVVRLAWSPGGPVSVAVPEARVRSGSLKLAAFPWPLSDVAAELAYGGERLEIRSFSGWHDDTHVYTRKDGYAVAEADGGWQVRFEDLHVDDLTLDRRFRETLPPDLRSVVEELDPRRQPVSLAGMVHLRGGGPDVPIVTAAWDVALHFSGSDLDAGTVLKDLHGRVTTTGTWDGRKSEVQGMLDLDSVYALDYQLTQVRGPFRIVEDRVELGSRLALRSERAPHPASLASSDQITAKAIGGVVSVNGSARLGHRPTYNLRIALREGRLEQYARQYLPGTKNLAGVMNGDVVLEGRGPSPRDLRGNGRLQISPAALYELPVIARVLGSLGNLNALALDKTAFKYADLAFDIGQSQFRFQQIDLVGDAISLRGRGSVGFDGQVQLDFYSMMPRTAIGSLLGEAGKGWVGVKVRGKTSDPRAEATAVPELTGALREFLRVFETGPSSMVPRLMPSPWPQRATWPDEGRPSGSYLR